MLAKTLLAASAISLFAMPAMSAPLPADLVVTTGSAPRATVAIADLNLASPEGAARLNSRIEAAAAGLCLTSAVEPVAMRVARAGCYRAAISSGRRQIDRMTAGRTAVAATAIVGGNGR